MCAYIYSRKTWFTCTIHILYTYRYKDANIHTHTHTHRPYIYGHEYRSPHIPYKHTHIHTHAPHRWQWHGEVPPSCQGPSASDCTAHTHWWRRLTFPAAIDPANWTADSTPAPILQKILFFYEAGATHRFFDDEWLRTVDRAVSIDADHWMPCRRGAAETINAEIERWLG